MTNLEILDFSTDIFLNAMRGHVRQIWFGQGTSFVGAKNELKKDLMQLEIKTGFSLLLLKNTVTFRLMFPEKVIGVARENAK